MDLVTTMPQLPVPNAPIAVRPGTREDIPFIDALQKRYGKALGFFPRAQLEGYIDGGHVLIATDATTGSPVGYVAARDRYLKRDELGAIFQLCVSPDAQRGLVGATLLKELFARSAYGTKLYCCWCAQDLAANKFWEAMGFVPLAFRGGSSKKSRVHIFWQKRTRANDTTTPWWFPAKTDGGAIREDRLVLPIPPGLRWHDEMPTVEIAAPDGDRRDALAAGSATSGTRKRPESSKPRSAKLVPGMKAHAPPPTPRPRAAAQFGPPKAIRPAIAPDVSTPAAPLPTVPAKMPRAKPKCDPTLVAAAREMRDRWLEHVNTPGALPATAGKYDVSRSIEATKIAPLLPASTVKLLPAA